MKVSFLSATHLLTAVLTLFLAAETGLADDSASKADAGQRFVTVGQLAREKIGGTKRSRFVLLDESGAVISRLRPSEAIDLSPHLGQEVGVTARTLVDGEIPILLAERVSTFGPANEPPIQGVSAVEQGRVALAAYDQEIVAVDGAVSPSPLVGPLVPQEEIVMDYGPIVEEAGPGHLAGCSGNCNGGCTSCNRTGACGPPGQFWLRSEYLLWWTDSMDTPSLVTTSPAGTARADAGVLGRSGTETVFGGDGLFDGSRSGARFRLGKWCDSCQWIGFEAEYFFLGDESDGYYNCDIGQPILARPFFNTDTNSQDAELIQFPGVVVGKINVDAETSFWSISPRFRINLACEQLCDPRVPNGTGSYRFDMLLGYRHLSLDDDIRIRESLTTVDGRNGLATPPSTDLLWNPDAQTYFDVRDSFDTSNDFHGADLGLLWEGYRGRWSLELVGRVGLGSTNQQVRINGSTVTSAAGTTLNERGGILALNSNIGEFDRDKFTVIPEFGATLGYAMSPRARFVVGYTFLYWNEVVRAGDQIDLNVNPDLIPTPVNTTGSNSPSFAFVDSSFWAQGLSLGLDYRW